MEGSNNFWLYFGHPSDHPVLAEVYGQNPAFRRFCQRYPEQTAELRRLIRATPDHQPPDRRNQLLWQIRHKLSGGEAELPPEAAIWPKLHEAYRLMSALVDRDDDDVYQPESRDPYRRAGGGIDTWHLCR
jgi:hypothetical protein